MEMESKAVSIGAETLFKDLTPLWGPPALSPFRLPSPNFLVSASSELGSMQAFNAPFGSSVPKGNGSGQTRNPTLTRFE